MPRLRTNTFQLHRDDESASFAPDIQMLESLLVWNGPAGADTFVPQILTYAACSHAEYNAIRQINDRLYARYYTEVREADAGTI